MSDENPSAAFEGLFTEITTVVEQIDLLHHTFEELMRTVDSTADDDDDEATVELVVAAVGAVGVALRVLAQHLQETIPHDT